MTEKGEKSGAVETPIVSLDTGQRSTYAWALVEAKIRQGEGQKEALIWGIRNGVNLPDDFEVREWIADALEGKHDPKRGRGAPKKRKRWSMVRAAVEQGIEESYRQWLAAFRSNRELAWLRAEGRRLRQERPDDAAWHRSYDLGTEEGRQSYQAAVTGLGARPCPPAGRGSETPRELALKATAVECRERWKGVGDTDSLTPAVVARIIPRAKKSE